MIAKLRPNPFSQVTIRHRGAEAVDLRVWSVTRSRRATTKTFARATHADFERMCRIAWRANAPEQSAVRPPIEEIVLLAALGLWAPELDLIDPVFIEAPIESAANLVTRGMRADEFGLRGTIWLQHGAEAPASVRDFPLELLSPARPILWHQGADAEPILPWWPDAKCLTAIAAMQAGAPLTPDAVPSLAALAAQGILTRRTAEPARPSDRCSADEACRASFSRDGFVDLGRVLPPGQIAAIRAYWHKLAALDVLPRRGDGPGKYGSHGEPSSALLLRAFTPLIAHMADMPIQPAYSFAWLYDRNAELAAHRDRNPCRLTVSYLADYAPATDDPTPWPLCVRPRGGGPPREFRQSVGDAFLLSGQELEHFRPPFTAGERSVSLLMHYVDRDFSGKLF
jgi:hypothetical protein